MTVPVAGSNSSATPFQETLPALLLLALVFLLNFVSRVIFSPLLPEIEKNMGLPHAVAGSFFLFISSGYFLSILFSGAVSSRIGHKWTIVLSMLGSAAMLVGIGFCSGITEIRLGLFGLGYGAGLYLQSGLATITRLVAPSHLARGMAVHELAPNLGFVIAPLLCGIMLNYFSWRQGLQLLGLALALMGCLYGVIGETNGRPGKKKVLTEAKYLMRLPQFWLLVLLFSLAICSTLGIYAMLPLYLVTEQGMDQDTANRLVAVSRISSVFMPLVAAWFGDRFGNGLVMQGVLIGAGIGTIPLGFLSGYSLVACVVLQPMIAVCFFPSGFAVLSGVGGGNIQGGAVSLCIPLAFLMGGGVIPMAIGAVGDHYSLAAALSAIGCCTVAVAVIAFWFGQRRGLLS